MTNPNRPTDDLLAQHGDFVRRVARGLVGDESAVDDVVQQTYVAAIERPPRRPGALRSWLGRVARNFALKSRAREAATSRRERAAARPEGLPSAAEMVEREALLRNVVEAVLALEEPYRGTVLLRFFDDLSAQEIAARSGIPASTVRTRLERALRQLRGKLDEEHGDRERWSAALLVSFARGPGGSAAGPPHPGEPGPTGPAHHTASQAGRAVMRAGLRKAGMVAVALVATLALVAAMWEPSPDSSDAADSATKEPVSIEGAADRAPREAASAGPTERASGSESGTVADAIGRSISGEVRRLDPDQPAAGVEVTLVGGDTQQLTSTDERGYFRFADVPAAGPFTVIAKNDSGPSPRVRDVLLAPDEARFIDTLWLGAPLGVAVEVVDETGEGVASARVEAYRAHSRPSRRDFTGTVPAPEHEGTTNARGTLSLAGLTPGRWSIRATHDDFAPGGVADVEILRSGAITNVRVVLEKGAPLTGRVTGIDGEPVADVVVVALAPRDGSSGFYPFAREVLRAEAVSDASGNYLFPALARGPHSIGVAASGGSVARLWIVEVPSVERYDIRIGGGGLRGVVRDEDTGAGLAGVVVRAAAWRSHHPTYWMATTDAAGNYEMPIAVASVVQGAAQGTGNGRVQGIHFTASKPGYVMIPGGVDSFGQGGWITGGEFSQWDVTMRRGASLSGSVTGPEGPVAGAQVTAEVWHAVLGSVSSTTHSDGDGRYLFPGLLEGRAKVTAAKDGYLQVPQSAGDWIVEPHPPAEMVAEIPARGSAALDLQLQRGSSVTGTVVGPSGAALEGATVSTDARGTRPAVTDSDGGFVIRGVPPATTLVVRAFKAGFGRWSGEVDVPATDEAPPLAVKLEPALIVHGSVSAESGGPPTGTFVQVADADRLEQGSYVLVGLWQRCPKHPVGRDGGFSIPLESAGKAIRVRATAPGFAPAISERVEVSAGTEVDGIALRLSRGHTLRGRVVSSDGAGGVAGATVEFVNAEMPLEISQRRADTFNAGGRPFEIVAVTDAEGRFEVHALPPWNYDVRVMCQEHRGGRLTVRVPGEDEALIEVDPGHSISGAVRYDDGEPVAGVNVVALPVAGGGPAGQAGTDRAGEFRMRWLPPGSYRLRVQQTALRAVDVLPTLSEPVDAGDEGVELVVTRGAGRISGVCVSPTGEPIPGAIVAAKPMPPGHATQPTQPAQATSLLRTQADANGEFLLTGLEDVRYTLIVQGMRGVGGPENWGTRSSVELLDVPVGTVDVRLQLEETLAWTGTVVREDGEPLPHGTQIHIRQAPSSPWTLLGRLGANGAFSFGTVRPVPYTVTILDPTTGAPLPLAGDGVFTPSTTPTRIVVPTRAAVAGTVVDANRRPLAGAVIRAFDPDDAQQAVAVTDAHGRFQLPGLTAGVTYRLDAAHPRHGFAQQTGVRIGDAGLRLALDPKEPLQVRLIDAEGQPARGVDIELLLGTGSGVSGNGNGSEAESDSDSGGRVVARLRTDAEGRASTIALAAGTYTVRVAGGAPLGEIRTGSGEVELRTR